MKRILGLDLSISCTGVAGPGWATTIPTPAYTKNAKKDPVAEERKRLDNHHARLSRILAVLNDQYFPYTEMVVMEGLAFEAPDMGRQNAGLAWIVRHQLVRLGIPYALVPAPNLKMFATGSGAAKKAAVVAAVEGWFPGLLEGTPATQRDNPADATVLVAMAAQYLGEPLVTAEPRQLRALAKCFWPELPSDAAFLSPLVAAA